MSNFIDDPNWKVEAIKNDVSRNLFLDVSEMKIYRAKRKAQDIVKGSMVINTRGCGTTVRF